MKNTMNMMNLYIMKMMRLVDIVDCCRTYIWSNYSDLTRPHPKWWFSKGNPLISGKSRLVKYYNLARYINLFILACFTVLPFSLQNNMLTSEKVNGPDPSM